MNKIKCYSDISISDTEEMGREENRTILTLWSILKPLFLFIKKFDFLNQQLKNANSNYGHL